MPNLTDYLAEIVTNAQACGAFPEMREMQEQVKAARARFDHGGKAEARNKQ